ncbi:glycosyl transferase [Bacteroidia bacterium]|nr:glycosyl transferase [Bacteroidia bacterium]
MRYSVIVPVYNRPDEVAELLESLLQQSSKNFEVLIVEDADRLPCAEVVGAYSAYLNLRYFNVPKTSRSHRRNYGMQQAQGDYFVFWDSDCIIPPDYFAKLDKNLQAHYSDCFGGPDAAHESFTDMQKAVNFAMTSFFTTGGIRGGKRQMEKFKPRTFNMGFSRAVFDRVGGFNDMFGEDIDLSIRIAGAGFRTMLFNDLWVYHKRRIDFKKFFKQVHNFGVARINLAILHKGSLKIVHTFPALFLLGCAAILLLSMLASPYFLLLIAFYTLLLFVAALLKTKKIKIALWAIVTSYIQLWGYGIGFIKSFVQKIILRKGLENSQTLQRIYN